MNYHYSANVQCHKGLIVMILCAPLLAWAGEDAHLQVKTSRQTLPNLPEPNTEPGYFNFDSSEFTLGYDTRMNKWSATADYANDGRPTLNAYYGYATSRERASGANVIVGKNYKEIFLNEIYSPSRDVRFRFTGGQRLQNNYQFLANSEAATVSQNSYMVQVRKAWNDSPLSRAGLTFFDMQANVQPRSGVFNYNDGLTMAPLSSYTAGSMQGYALNFRLEPTSQSQIDLDLGAHRRSSFLGTLVQKQENTGAYSVHFTQYLDDCSRLRTEYSAVGGENSVNLSVRTGAWRIGLSSVTSADTNRALAFNLGYTLPLGGMTTDRSQCGFGTQTASAFKPVVDDAIARPSTMSGRLLMQPMY